METGRAGVSSTERVPNQRDLIRRSRWLEENLTLGFYQLKSKSPAKPSGRLCIPESALLIMVKTQRCSFGNCENIVNVGAGES